MAPKLLYQFQRNFAHTGYPLRNFSQVRSKAKSLKLKRFIVNFTLTTILNVLFLKNITRKKLTTNSKRVNKFWLTM